MSILPLAPHKNHGTALVLVLCAIVIVSLLTVAFFGSVSHELVSSKNFSSGVSSRIYADSAVNLVIGQLQAGTTQDTPTKTWVSQPGLIRLFDNAGNQEKVFKLYSSNKMVEAGTFSPTTAGGAPSDVPAWTSASDAASLPWNASPNVYTDLNSPIVVNSVPNYPILSPGGLAATSKIEGFDVSSTYALPDSSDMNGNGDKSEIGQIPMPVRWVYILTDGRIGIPDATAGGPNDVTLTTTDGQPVKGSNPPVARVAFWTDDNTCRLNINTASEGSSWMIPVAATADRSLATGQINPKEYQRYPGHPAMTSLSPVLNLLTAKSASSTDLRNFIFALAPRVSGRGSQFGSRYIGSTKPVTPDNDRLYASVDELLFLPNVNSGDGKRYPTTTQNIQTLKSAELDWVYTGGSQSMTGKAYTFANNFALDARALEQARFFLTANSRAPEVNLYGQPRISMWPVDTRTDHQSLFDRLLAFSSTVGGEPYYFQRQNPNSQTDDYSLIPRNQELIADLNHLTGTPVPGFGGTFTGKYGVSNCQQLTAALFDWIRTVNLAYRDKAGVVQPYDWIPNTSAVGAKIPPGNPGSGQVLPIKINGSQGYGRFPTLSKAAVGIVREAEDKDTPTAGKTTVTYRVVFLMETYVPMLGYAGYVPNYHIHVSNLTSVGNPPDPPVGFELVTDTLATAASPIVKFVDFQDGDILVTAPSNFEAFTGRGWGGTQGFNNLFAYSDGGSNNQLTARTLGSIDARTGYPFVSSKLQVVYPTVDKDKIRVGLRPSNGAASRDVSISLYDGTNSQAITSFTVPFASFGPLTGAFLANPSATATANSNGTGSGTGDMHTDLQERVNQMAAAGMVYSGGFDQQWTLSKYVIGHPDVVRGVELQHGDLRLPAIHGSDANNVFVAHRDYTNTAYPQAHSLLLSAGSSNNIEMAQLVPVPGAWSSNKGNWKIIRRGTLVSNTSSLFYNTAGSSSSFVPQVPSAVSAASAPGDFSTGIASESDGPHIMKADEGNSSFSGLNWGGSDQIPYQNQLFPYNDVLSDSFSPNRQVASAVQFGTLPSQAASSVPWQTLLFRPDFAGTHPGANSPPDYLLLDLFWMPVIDPYPISEALSTAGKVNMNYQIAPFTYINRSTAMIGALKAGVIEAIPQEYADIYKQVGYTPSKNNNIILNFLYSADTTQTLLFFKDRFSGTDPSKNIFKSASEICSIPIVPTQNVDSPIGTGHSTGTPAHPLHTVGIAGATDAATLRDEMKKFWDFNTLTGDNVMEAPYNSLYPRLTTQSNTYTVYVRAQALQVPVSTTDGKFTNVTGRVSGEYRGSFEIERYLDSKDTKIPDFATDFTKTIYPYYKFRILSAKQFIP